jgi:hypothetical protein
MDKLPIVPVAILTICGAIIGKLIAGNPGSIIGGIIGLVFGLTRD